jgi:hypothetical protein
MSHPFSFAPAIVLNITLVIGISVTLSAAALGLLLRRWWRPRRKPRRGCARWEFDYQSTTGLRLRLSKMPPREFPTNSEPSRAARFAALQHDNRVNN